MVQSSSSNCPLMLEQKYIRRVSPSGCTPILGSTLQPCAAFLACNHCRTNVLSDEMHCVRLLQDYSRVILCASCAATIETFHSD